MITRTIAQMTHLDLFLITTHSSKTVKYLPNRFPPDNFLFFRKLWHFPDTFATYYKQVVFPRKYVWALESFYHGTRLVIPTSLCHIRAKLLEFSGPWIPYGDKHALPCWVVLLSKGDMYLWIYPTFFPVIQLIYISWAVYLRICFLSQEGEKKNSAQLHAPSWVKRLQIITQIFCLDFKPSNPSSHSALLLFLRETLLFGHLPSWDLHLSGSCATLPGHTGLIRLCLFTHCCPLEGCKCRL